MAKSKGYLSGFLGGMNFTARLSEVSFLTMMQRAIDNKEYERLGYETVREWIKEDFDFSYDTLNNRLKVLRAYGPEVIGSLVRLGFSKRDVKMIEHILVADEKTGKKGVKLGDRVVPLDEAHLEDIQLAIDNMREAQELSRKAEKQAKKDHDRLKAEFDKGDSPAKKRLAELEALAGVPDTHEKVVAGFERIDKAFSELETVIRTFIWKDAKKLIADDPALQAKVEGVQRQMQARAEQIINDWDGEINNG